MVTFIFYPGSGDIEEHLIGRPHQCILINVVSFEGHSYWMDYHETVFSRWDTL